MAALVEIPNLVAAISSDLTAAGIRHLISGAAAMAAYGYIRATRDIDILVIVPSTRLPEVFAIVRRHGFQGEDQELIQSLRLRYVAELRSALASIELLVPALPYHHRLAGRAVTMSVAGRPVPFVSIEDLIILKFLWHRAKDVPDIHALLAMKGAAIDDAYLRETLRSILPADDPRHAELDSLLRRFAG